MRPFNPISPNASTEKFTRPRVLLVEPDLDVLSDRTLLLSRSKYTVAPASSYREIFDLRSEIGFGLAILNDSLGGLALRAAAEFVRRQWPSARILILGNAQAALEDFLYDEVVNHRIESRELLDTLARMSEDSWTLRSRLLGLGRRDGVRFDPVDRITFYSRIVHGLAPIRAELQAQMRADEIPKD